MGGELCRPHCCPHRSRHQIQIELLASQWARHSSNLLLGKRSDESRGQPDKLLWLLLELLPTLPRISPDQDNQCIDIR